MSAPRKTTAVDQKPLSRRILVEISHPTDMTTKVPKVIWHHELAILEEVHGGGNVKMLDPGTMNDGYKARISPDLLVYNKRQDQIQRPSDVASIGFVFFGDAETEYARLCSAYGRHVDVNSPVAEVVYGRFQDGRFERFLGLAEFSDMPDAQLRQLVTSHGYLPQLGMDPTPEERKAAGDAYAKLANMPRAELLKLTEELAAEYA